MYARPRYQDAFVPPYLVKLGSTNAGRFNASGRGIPDIAAAAVNYPVYAFDSFYSIRGTSAASPTMADIIALLNDRLISAGRPTLGFLNPFLYANPGAFNDITTGESDPSGPLPARTYVLTRHA